MNKSKSISLLVLVLISLFLFRSINADPQTVKNFGISWKESAHL